MPTSDANDTALESLIAALKDGEEWERRDAAEALGQLGDRRAVEPLIAALARTEDWAWSNDAYWVACALGELGDQRALEPLIAALSYPSGEARSSAATGLGLLGDERAADALIAAQEDEEDKVRRKVKDALGKVGGARGSKAREDAALKVLKQQRQGRGPQPSQSQLFEAVGELASLKSKRAIRPLIKVILEETNYDLQTSCRAALAEIGEPALEPIATALGDERNFPSGSGARGFLEQAKSSIEKG